MVISKPGEKRIECYPTGIDISFVCQKRTRKIDSLREEVGL